MNCCDQSYRCVNVIESGIAVDLLANVFCCFQTLGKNCFGVKKWKHFLVSFHPCDKAKWFSLIKNDANPNFMHLFYTLGKCVMFLSFQGDVTRAGIFAKHETAYFLNLVSTL